MAGIGIATRTKKNVVCCGFGRAIVQNGPCDRRTEPETSVRPRGMGFGRVCSGLVFHSGGLALGFGAL